MDKRSFSILNDVTELHEMQAKLEALLEEWELPPKAAMHLNLVLEEVVSNIIFYAYEDDRDHEISFELHKEKDEIKIRIMDDGKAFDPLSGEEFSERDKPAEERKIGGLGIHFVKELMDEISYRRKNEKNYLYLVKKL